VRDDTQTPVPVEFFAAASPGTESALLDELKELGLPHVRAGRGGIPFRGAWVDGWRACLHSRIAQRVLAVVARYDAADAAALYAGARLVDWSRFLSPDHSLAVAAVAPASDVFRHSGFVALKVKDAIVDSLRERFGARPDVDRADPDLRVSVYVHHGVVTLYVDLSGEPLSRRGYRTAAGEAPLRETLAAAVLRLSGWDRIAPLLDPMCGSGTLAIEAALWAAGIAPGILRARFGFERWACFDTAGGETMRAMRGESRRRAAGRATSITAADIDETALAMARANATRAGVRIAFRHRSLLERGDDGVRRMVVANPPYNVRLDADSRFCRDVTAAFCRMPGCRVALLAGTPEYRRVMSLPAVAAYPLMNGDLPCELLVYEVPPA
jgi:putative N6-adenine-specific DNA methylase